MEYNTEKILERIDELRKERNLSVYTLAKLSGLNQSTISNMFARKTAPSLETLFMLCKGLDISVSSFFDENGLSQDEMFLLSAYKRLSPENKKMATDIICAISVNNKE